MITLMRVIAISTLAAAVLLGVHHQMEKTPLNHVVAAPTLGSDGSTGRGTIGGDGASPKASPQALSSILELTCDQSDNGGFICVPRQ